MKEKKGMKISSLMPGRMNIADFIEQVQSALIII